FPHPPPPLRPDRPRRGLQRLLRHRCRLAAATPAGLRHLRPGIDRGGPQAQRVHPQERIRRRPWTAGADGPEILRGRMMAILEADLTWTGERFESGIQIAVGEDGRIAETGALGRAAGVRLTGR